MMLAKHDQPLNKEQLDSVMSMKDEIRRRMELPADQWIRMDENDTMFEDIRARLREKYGDRE